MKQEEVNIEVVNIDDLIQDDHNFNKGNEQGAQLLERSFRECGAGRSVLIDKDNRLVGGNKAQKGFKAAGKKKVIIVDSDADTLVAVRRKDVSLDSAEGRKMAYLDNLTTQVNLTWDETELQAVQADVEGFDIADFGFDIEDLPQVTFPTGEKQGEGEGKPQTEVKEDDFDPDAHYETKVKAGEVWQLGEHRLMCGDSTDADAVSKLMNGERADLVFTDPPYGMFLDVDYDGMFANDDTRAFDTGKRFDKVKGDNDDFKPELITTIFDNFGDCPEVFIWGADYFSELIPNRKDGSWVVWDKRCSEEMDKVAGNTFELCWSKAKHKRLIARIEWSGFHGMNGADSGKRVHPTQKPIALIDFFIKHWGEKANIVVDLFGGSGTTAIACEQLGRKARLMELDPHYCDVIIARWEKLTGQKAERLNL